MVKSSNCRMLLGLCSNRRIVEYSNGRKAEQWYLAESSNKSNGGLGSDSRIVDLWPNRQMVVSSIDQIVESSIKLTGGGFKSSNRQTVELYYGRIVE